MDKQSESDLLRVERWRRLATTAEVASRRDFRYPSTDPVVDETLLQQDAGKTNREIELLRREVAGDWRVAVDFGAGVGRNLPLFDSPSNVPRLVVAVEPDPARACAAERTAQSLRHVDAVVSQGDIQLVDSWPAGEVDLATCVQVLGHVGRAEFFEVVAGLHRLLRRGGKLVVCVPVVGAGFVGQSGGGDWVPPSDFFHVVDPSRAYSAPGFRVPVTPEQHDLLARGGGGTLLPVRSFFLPDWPARSTARLPFTVGSTPAPLAEVFATRFVVVATLLYSVHRLAPENDTACIGDLLLVLRKR